MTKLAVLMYHKIAKNHTDFLTVDTSSLINQLEWLKTQYNFIKLSDLVAHIEEQKPLPESSILITFDDGYENNYDLAYPVFKQLSIPFSIFLVGNFISQKVNYDGEVQSFLSINQLKQMSDLVEYGFHSAQHKNIMQIPVHQWGNEISEGVKILRQMPIQIQNIWAYTYGSFPKKNQAAFEQLQTIFKSEGIVGAFRIGNRKNSLPLKSPFAIQRIDIRGNESFLKFKWKVWFGKII
jgi:peptidoglycan/xylan/chitin deacetylase (PgdA/CDA1 family)